METSTLTALARIACKLCYVLLVLCVDMETHGFIGNNSMFSVREIIKSLKSSIHQSYNMTNKRLARIRSWIKINIRHTENMVLLPVYPTSISQQMRKSAAQWVAR